MLLTSYPKGFSGIKDVDLQILSNLDDKDLFNACLSNKYLNNICKTSDMFWKNRIINNLGAEYLQDKLSFRDYYIQFIMLLNLDDLALINKCIENKYSYICDDELFWKKRLEKRFGIKYDEFKNAETTWKTYYLDIINYLNRFRRGMKREIKSTLTEIRKYNENLKPYKEEKIKKFIKKNNERIEAAVIDMFDTLRNENDLANIDSELYRQYLFKHIPYKEFMKGKKIKKGKK